MKTLVLYSVKQLGTDPYVKEMAASLSAHSGFGGEVTVIAVDTDNIDPSVFYLEYDMILCLDAAEWYLANKLIILGRPWTVLVSTCFDDLRHLIQLNVSIHESGFHCLFTNSVTVVKRASAAFPVLFSWKPLASAKVSLGQEEIKLGTVINTVNDTDFSQIAQTQKWLKQAGDGLKLEVLAFRDPHHRIPEEISDITYVDRDQISYMRIKNYVPAPRITDLAASIVSPNLIGAMASGCSPLLLMHPVYKSISTMVEPMARSLKELKSISIAAASGKQDLVRLNLSKDIFQSVDQFVDKKLWVAYERWRANASS
jgi:hypothetical protein